MSQDNPETSAAATGPGLTDVKKTDTGWEVTLEGYTEPGAVGSYLWPGGVPDGVTITASTVVLEPAQIGTFELTGVTIDALQSMDPSTSGWFAQAGVLTADQPDQEGSPQAADSPIPPSGQDTAQSPEGQQQAIDWETFITEAIHTALEFASWFAKEGGNFVTFFEGAANPAGYILMLYDLFGDVIEAFQEELKDMRQQGYIYGLLLEATGLPTPTPEADPGFVLPMHSFEEKSAAFMEGLTKGRQDAAGDIKLNNSIAAQIGYGMVTQKVTEEDAATDLLGELLTNIGVTKAVFIENPTL
jgi:hypothetical protein